jgi:hypothetical protein
MMLGMDNKEEARLVLYADCCNIPTDSFLQPGYNESSQDSRVFSSLTFKYIFLIE